MNRKLLAFSTVFSGVLYLTPLQAHNPGHYGGYGSGVSGSVTIWSAPPYGTGYSGTINYGPGYAVVPPYPGAYFYPACNHWHPKAYRAPRHHAYGKGYAHGYSDAYYGGHNGHKKSSSKHHNGHGPGHGYDNGHHD